MMCIITCNERRSNNVLNATSSTLIRMANDEPRLQRDEERGGERRLRAEPAIRDHVGEPYDSRRRQKLEQVYRPSPGPGPPI